MKAVLDPCCGTRMMWFDHADPRALFGDRRCETITVTDRSHRDDGTRVLRIERVPGATLPAPPPRHNLLAALRASAEQLCRCTDLEGLLGQTLDCLELRFDIGPFGLGLLFGCRNRIDPAGRKAESGHRDKSAAQHIRDGHGVISPQDAGCERRAQAQIVFCIVDIAHRFAGSSVAGRSCALARLIFAARLQGSVNNGRG